MDHDSLPPHLADRIAQAARAGAALDRLASRTGDLARALSARSPARARMILNGLDRERTRMGAAFPLLKAAAGSVATGEPPSRAAA